MKNRRTLIAAAAVVALIGWYAFRPELLFIDAVASEAPPDLGAARGSVRYSGQFHGVAHEGAGTATVFQASDGRRVLRFTAFDTSNGPDLHVYLVAALDASDSAAVRAAETVTLGPLKGNVGDQNYDIPAGVDLDRFRAVTIWCRRFGVNFATAPLRPADESS